MESIPIAEETREEESKKQRELLGKYKLLKEKFLELKKRIDLTKLKQMYKIASEYRKDPKRIYYKNKQNRIIYKNNYTNFEKVFTKIKNKPVIKSYIKKMAEKRNSFLCKMFLLCIDEKISLNHVKEYYKLSRDKNNKKTSEMKEKIENLYYKTYNDGKKTKTSNDPIRIGLRRKVIYNNDVPYGYEPDKPVNI